MIKPINGLRTLRSHASEKMTTDDKRSAPWCAATGPKHSHHYHYTVLTFLDAVFSATIAGPAVVGYWRGTWNLSSAYIYPADARLSSLVSILIGFSGLFVFNLGQHLFATVLNPDKHRLVFYLGSRLYTAIFGICCVNAWRGTWLALDLYTELSFNSVFTTTCLSLLVLATMRTLRNISAPPFAISLDTFDSYFDVPTLFRVNVSVLFVCVIDQGKYRSMS